MADTIQMNMKRMRGRGQNRHGGGGGGGGGGGHFRHAGGGGGGGGGGGHQPMNRNHVFDSTGPDMRLRGTAQQLFEKYLQLGRDATSGGDRVMAEGYFQHAEHYFRILNAMNQAQQQHAPQQQQRGGRYQGGPEQGSEGGQDGNGQEQAEYEGGGEAQQVHPVTASLEAEREAGIQQEPREREYREPRDRDRDPRDRDRDPRERDFRERESRDRDRD